MDRSHLSGVADLEKLCFTTPWNEAMLEEELYNDTASFIVAQGENGEVLGYAGLHVILDEGYIDNVAVEPAARRHGVADALLDVFCRFGQAKLAFLTLEVRASNDSAKRLYMKHGFAQVGRRKDYYDDPREDAILMTRTFGGDAEQEVFDE
jgi:ribosomal-protein-alanine N-acetyltransferase